MITASNEAFGLGSERTYSLINDVNIYDLKTPEHPFGYRIVGSLKVANVWGSDQDSVMLKFEVNFKGKQTNCNYLNNTFYFSSQIPNYSFKNSSHNPNTLTKNVQFLTHKAVQSFMQNGNKERFQESICQLTKMTIQSKI